MTERGHASVEFAMAVGVLLFPVALVVMSFGPWLETRVWAESAAAETARVAAIDLDLGAGEQTLAALANERELASGSYRLGWCSKSTSPTKPSETSCILGRGAVVVVRLEVWTPLFTTPWGEIGGLWVVATHAEPVDLYRSTG